MSVDNPVGNDLPIPLDADLALSLIAAARDEARRVGVRLSYAIVDSGGNVVASLRDDGAQLGALSLANDKAFTAVSFGMPTSAWAESSLPGGSDWGLAGLLGGRAVVFAGGLPLYSRGELVGAIGVSGTASAVDEACARAAIIATGLRSER